MNYKRLMIAAVAAVALLVGSQSHAAPRVDLGSAGSFAILAKSGISGTGATSIVGDIGVSPVGATAITGFGLVLDASGTFSTSSVVVGKVLAADYMAPTPANLTAAVSDMETAYTDAAGRAPNVTELGAGNIGGMTLVPGVYKWSTGLTIPTDLRLAGGAKGVWIFQIAGNLDVSSGVEVVLAGGARPRNIFWQVAGQTTLGTTSRFKGVILDQTAVVMNAGATLDGMALAQTAVTLNGNAVNSQAISALVDDFYAIESNNDPNDNTCEVGADGNEFQAFGAVNGSGTGGEAVRITYNTPQPTSATRSETKLTVKQSSFSLVDIRLHGVSATGGPIVVEKCSIDGSVDTKKLTGSVSANCKTDDLFTLLTANQIASILTAFNGNKDVKVKVNTDTLKGSISIKCSGDASLD